MDRRTGERRFIGRPAIASAVAALSLMALGATVAAADDVRDATIITRTLNRALETQKTQVPARWSNRATGNSGTVVVTRTYFQDDGTPCREYTRTTETRDTVTKVLGVGCRTGGGFWSRSEGSLTTTLKESPRTRTAAAPPPPSPAAAKTPKPPGPSPDEPAEDAAAAAPAGFDFRPPVPPRKPVVIAASLPSKSDE